MKSNSLIPSLLASTAALTLSAPVAPAAAQGMSLSVPATQAQSSDVPDPGMTQPRETITKNAPTPERRLISYECINRGDALSTIAHTLRGRIELVKWESTFFGSYWTPERRCQEITNRLQQFSDTQQLRYISWGRQNNYKILCVSEDEGTCIHNGLLLTLEHSDNPVRVLRSLFDYKTPVTRGGKTVIDIEELLQAREPLSEVSAAESNRLEVSPDDQSSLLESQFDKTRLEVAPVFRGE